MKTEQSQRDIPLVGVSLMAAQLHPHGFPRYRDRAASLSALVNKVMSGRGLLPGPGYTLYSLRHTFEDRLTKVEAPDKVAAALMGHKFHRPRYGLGPSLEQKFEWLQRIAFAPPSRV
jgi:integrase